MASTIKVKILRECTHCEGRAYLPTGEALDSTGKIFTQYKPCKNCEGTGMVDSSITLVRINPVN